jgi:DNA polymerase III epsilon subunit family exonuclease
VVDLETTGGSPGHSKVTEIGAVRVRGLRVVERFSTLVDPGRPIPPVVTDITGIDDAMVAGSPDIETALARFVEFAGQDVLVAHNAPFDLRFLNYERRRLAGRYFTQPWLDTLVLARRLLNGQVPRHDLGTLASWADTTVRPIHRALPDAEATAELLGVLVGLLAERGIETLERAVAFAGAGGARHAFKLALAEDLPARPGVYLMRDREGRPLYVGKASNLRRRVRAYFGPGGRHGRLIGRALEQLEAIDHEVCGSEFAALLREDRLLKQLRPPCNRRGVGAPGRYLKLSLGSFQPRLYVVGRMLADGGAYFGPVRSERLAREAVACLGELYPLEGPDEAARVEAVERVQALLEGDPRALGELGLRLGRAVAEGRVEIDPGDDPGPAGALLSTLAALSRARRAARCHAVLVERGAQEGVAEAFFVAAGTVRHSARLTADDWREPARQGLAILRSETRRAGGLAPAALDEATIVEARLCERARTDAALRLEPGWRTDGALAWIGRAVAAVAGPG